jgi:deoxyribonuclease V
MDTHREPCDEGGERPLELLECEIGELAAHIHAATCRWLVLVEEFDRRNGWWSWGCKSCAQWLSHTCALSTAAAREQVRVARRLAELPAIRAAFGRGELSYSQVRALSRVATPELEPALLETARHATAAQLERVLRAYRGVLARELSPDDLTHGERYVVCEHDDDGSLLLRARLPADEGALVLAALEAARNGLRAASDGERDAQPSSAGRGVSAEAEADSTADAGADAASGATDAGGPPSNADALLAMAETLLAAGPQQRNGGDANQIVVHVDAAALSGGGDDDAGGCQLEHGEVLQPETARRLACDASVIRTAEELARVQRELAALTPPSWWPSGPRPLVAGCFVCFGRSGTSCVGEGELGWAAAALLAGDRRPVGTAVVTGTAGAPYEPGLLALREGPLLAAAVRALPELPEVVVANASGRDHPRGAGLALHLGAVLDLPSVGVTDRPLLASGHEPGPERGATSPLLLDGAEVARALRTRAGARAIVVHSGWRTDLEMAVTVVGASTRRARTPEPLRRARRAARLARASAEALSH